MPRLRFETVWPLAAVLGLFACVFGATLMLIQSYNNGRFVYALDDAYIHMAVAKHVVRDGVWGITRDGFTSLSSSPLWTLLLAGLYRLFGPTEWLPLAMNFFSALGALWLFHHLLLRLGLGPAQRFLISSAFLFLTPLPSAVFTGQEHVLHTFLILWLVWTAASILVPFPACGVPALATVCVPAFLAVSVRYESAFLVAAVSLLFFIKGEGRKGVLVAISGSLPILLYGAVSVLEGWSWLPTSLLLKGQMPDFHSLGAILSALGLSAYSQMMLNPHLLFPALGTCLFLIIASRREDFFQSRAQVIGAVFLIGLFLHLQLARMGWYYRYEAYLLGLAALVLACVFPVLCSGWHSLMKVRAKALSIGLALLAAWPLLIRGYGALISIPTASRNIYEQQIQMASFVHQYYEGTAVAANDIGAINYFADIHCLDLAGLGSRDVADLKRSGHLTPEAIARLCREAHVRIAIVYDSWYHHLGGLPKAWIKCGEWRIQNNIVCGSDIVSFYAVVPDEAEPLRMHLREFAPRLPERVIQSGPFIYDGGISAGMP